MNFNNREVSPVRGVRGVTFRCSSDLPRFSNPRKACRLASLAARRVHGPDGGSGSAAPEKVPPPPWRLGRNRVSLRTQSRVLLWSAGTGPRFGFGNDPEEKRGQGPALQSKTRPSL